MTSTAATAAGGVAGIVKGNGPSVAKELLSALLHRAGTTASFNLHWIGERGRHPIVVVLVASIAVLVLAIVVVVVACGVSRKKSGTSVIGVTGGKDPQTILAMSKAYPDHWQCRARCRRKADCESLLFAAAVGCCAESDDCEAPPREC